MSGKASVLSCAPTTTLPTASGATPHIWMSADTVGSMCDPVPGLQNGASATGGFVTSERAHLADLIFFFQFFSAAAVLSAVVLAAFAVVPTIAVVLHGLLRHLIVEPCVVGANLRGCGLLPEDFASRGTISNVAADFSSPHGRVMFGCLLLSSLTLFISQFSFWLPRQFERSDAAWLAQGEGVFRFVWLFAGSLAMAIVSLIPCPSDPFDHFGFNVVLSVLHMGGFLLCILVLILMEYQQLTRVEFALHRWRWCPWLSAEHLPDTVKVKKIPLAWDQEWRCFFLSGTCMCFLLLVLLQTPLTLGQPNFYVACASVLAEGLVGVCAYGDLLVMALWRVRPGRSFRREKHVFGPDSFNSKNWSLRSIDAREHED